ncbi:MAG: NIPSNAP family containing protein [Saprospiraceae bacterium]|nr:NIPSNAP family containing protein [Saprospiraceae bacterium]
MKRRDALKLSAALPLAATASTSVAKKDQDREWYELREYTIRFGSNQQLLNDYLEKALIPTLNQYNVKRVGVFREFSGDQPTKVYVLIPYTSLKDYQKVVLELEQDEKYRQLSQSYHAIAPEKAVYSRFDTTLYLAFEELSKMILPTEKQRFFELRTYEGYSEDAVRRKIQMFDKEEITLFKDVKLNPVFFGKAIAGKNMPYLTYLLAFEDLEERNRNWDVFIKDPRWATMSSKPEYANSVSNIIRTYLVPATFSQL